MARSRAQRLLPVALAPITSALVVGHGTPMADAAPMAQALYAWGKSASGQLGVATTNDSVPNVVPDFGAIADVQAGSEHTLALLSDGTVWAWGDNAEGQLGDGTTTLGLAPKQVAGLTGITAVSAGWLHSLAYRASDGRLWAWGSNSYGQLGLPAGAPAQSLTPVEITAPPNLVRIRACHFHNVALDAAATVWAWGANFYGQLGDGTTVDRPSPGPVLLAPAQSVTCGASHNAAVVGGQVYTWGLNSFGQLGVGRQDPPRAPNPLPELVTGLTSVVEVAGGGIHTLARTASGDLWAWGYNTEGQVGNGAVTPADTGVLSPAKLAISNVTAIAAGSIHSAALDGDGNVWAWGDNLRGSVGDNRTTESLVPKRVMMGALATHVSAGGYHTMVLGRPRGPASALAAGSNGSGQLGDGSGVSSSLAIGVALSSGALQMAGGSRHSLAVLGDGTVAAWGDNASGQLGAAVPTAASPESVALPLEPGQRCVSVAAGREFSMALRSDGTVWTWGAGDRGQLGNGAAETEPLPAMVPGLASVVSIAAGWHHALAVTSNGDVWAWGDNRCGQLGRPPSEAPQATPARVQGVFSITHVAGGACHSLARRAHGLVYAWGDGNRAQLGNESLRSDWRPARVPAIDRVTAIAAGAFHSLAVRDGRTWAWGDAQNGQIGNGSSFNYWFPTVAEGPAETTHVASGGFHSLALDQDGTVWSWGDGAAGQLGVGALGEAPVPVVVGGMPKAVSVSAGLSHTLVLVE